MFRLLDIPWWYYAIAVLIGAAVWKAWRWEGGLLAGYMFLVLVETVLIRKPFEGSHFQSELFWSWKEWDIQKNQILTNILMFIPIGILTGRIWKWKGLLVAIGFSMGIEVLQLLSQRGLCEFDDVIHNTFGAFIGICIVMVIRRSLKMLSSTSFMSEYAISLIARSPILGNTVEQSICRACFTVDSAQSWREEIYSFATALKELYVVRINSMLHLSSMEYVGSYCPG